MTALLITSIRIGCSKCASMLGKRSTDLCVRLLTQVFTVWFAARSSFFGVGTPKVLHFKITPALYLGHIASLCSFMVGAMRDAIISSSGVSSTGGMVNNLDAFSCHKLSHQFAAFKLLMCIYLKQQASLGFIKNA